jgi:hypothetical protein
MTICDHCKQPGDVRVISIRVAPEAGMANASARLTASLAHTDKSGLDYSLELCAACRQQLLAPLEALTARGQLKAAFSELSYSECPETRQNTFVL